MASPSGKKGKSSKKTGPPKGELTQRLESVKVGARDNVPRTDDSAGPLIFFLLLVFVSVGAVAWNFFGRLIAPSQPPSGSAPSAAGGAADTTAVALALNRPATSPVVSYGYDPSGRYLIPLQVELPDAADPLQALRAELNADAPAPGVDRLLPGATQIRDLRQEGTLALCDLPSTVFDSLPGEGSQHGLLEALTRAITATPGIDKVQFLLDGQKVDSTPDGSISLADPWTITNPLNILDSGVSVQQGTFFFLDSGKQWLVPVTLGFDPGPEPLRGRLERLMEGPPPGMDLAASVPSALSLDTVTFDAATGVLGIAFTTTDPPQEWGMYGPRRMTQAILATLAEETSIKAIWMTINDQDVWSVEGFAPYREQAAKTSFFNLIPPASG